MLSTNIRSSMPSFERLSLLHYAGLHLVPCPSAVAADWLRTDRGSPRPPATPGHVPVSPYQPMPNPGALSSCPLVFASRSIFSVGVCLRIMTYIVHTHTHTKKNTAHLLYSPLVRVGATRMRFLGRGILRSSSSKGRGAAPSRGWPRTRSCCRASQLAGVGQWILVEFVP